MLSQILTSHMWMHLLHMYSLRLARNVMHTATVSVSLGSFPSYPGLISIDMVIFGGDHCVVNKERGSDEPTGLCDSVSYLMKS